MEYRRDIDGLRAVAVLAVVLCHARIFGFAGGYVGVDVFFVISGYLITGIITREMDAGRFSLLAFYERRARRILPALAAVLIVCLAGGLFLMMPAELDRLGRSTAATVVFASNFHFARSIDYFAPNADLEPLLHTWSLAVEEQFYMFFPPLLMALAWLRRMRQALAAVAAISTLSLAASVALLGWKPHLVFYLIVFRAWELGAGAMLALTAAAPPQHRAAREALGLAGLAAILVPAVLYTKDTPFPGLTAAPPVLGTALLIWVGRAEQGTLANRFLSLRPLVWIGLISYSLYLWHWPILAFLRILQGAVELPMALSAGAVAASVLMAWLSYRFVEQPFRQHPPKGFGQSAIFTLAGGAIVLLGGVGESLHQNRGWSQRLPSDVARIAAAEQDRNPRRKECFTRAPSEGLCALGAKPGQTDEIDFLLIGDSHGEMLMPGIARAAARAGRSGSFAVRSGCPPLPAVSLVSGGADCDRQNRAMLAWLEARSDHRTVIIAARWTLWVEGTPAPRETVADARLAWNGSADKKTLAGNNAILVEAALDDFVARLTAGGRQVVLIGPVPEPRRDVPVETARRKLLGLSPLPDVSAADHDRRTARAEAALTGVAARHPGVRYIRLADLFCDQRTCRAFGEDGIPLYVDDDHVSRTTSETLLLRRLETIWPKPQR